MCEFTVFDMHVADAARCFAADAYAGEDGIGESAVGDSNVFGGAQEGIAFHATARFERDTIVAGGDIATIDGYVAAGIDVDTISITTCTADVKTFDGDIVTIRQMNGPHRMVLRSETFEQDIGTIDGLNQCRVAQGFVGRRAATEGIVTYYFTRAADTDVVGAVRVYQSGIALYPFAFPAYLGNGVVVKIGRT